MQLYHGNAQEDGQAHRGWIIGDFMSGGIQHSGKVEVKYGVHPKGDARSDWVTGEQRTTLFILQSGNFVMKFRDQDVVLENSGDYVVWGPGIDHHWEVIEDSVGITVRWVE